MTTPFVDQSERDYTREREAGEQFRHLKLIRREVAGGEEAAEEEVARLAKDFAETMGSRCLILADFAEEKGFPDFSKGVDGFVDAVIAGCELYADRAHPDGFVPITDEELAALMGRSKRTFANSRAEWMAWPGHGKAIEVKPNYQNPETLESVPHRYRPHITRLSAETTLDARLDPQAHTKKATAFKDAAGLTVKAAKGFVSRPPWRRKAKSAAELLMADAEAVVKRLKAAAARPVSAGHVNYERLEELHRQMREALAEFEDAFGFESRTSTHSSSTDKERVEAEPATTPDVEPDGRCVEAENDGFSEVEKITTSENSSFSDDPANFAHRAPPYVRVRDGDVVATYPDGAPPGFVLAIDAEAEKVKRRLANLARERREGGRDATLAG